MLDENCLKYFVELSRSVFRELRIEDWKSLLAQLKLAQFSIRYCFTADGSQVIVLIASGRVLLRTKV